MGWVGPLRLESQGAPGQTLRCRPVALCGATATVWRMRTTAGASAQMDRTKSILVGLVSTSTWLDWTWLASNQVQMDLVSALVFKHTQPYTLLHCIRLQYQFYCPQCHVVNLQYGTKLQHCRLDASLLPEVLADVPGWSIRVQMTSL
jgi:hypothetical protein